MPWPNNPNTPAPAPRGPHDCARLVDATEHAENVPAGDDVAAVLLGYPIHSGDPLASLVRSVALAASRCKHEHVHEDIEPRVCICLDCGSSSVEVGRWRPPSLLLRLNELAAIARHESAPMPGYSPHAPHLAPIVERLDELARVANHTTQREAHYLRQLEHGSRILERVVELVAPAPVVYRGERLVFPVSELEERYNEGRANGTAARDEVLRLVELLDSLVFRVTAVLATSVPFASLRLWASDLAYPRKALAELLDQVKPAEPTAEAGAHLDPRVRLAAFDLFTRGAAAGEISAVTGLAADVVDELFARWRTGKA